MVDRLALYKKGPCGKNCDSCALSVPQLREPKVNPEKEGEELCLKLTTSSVWNQSLCSGGLLSAVFWDPLLLLCFRQFANAYLFIYLFIYLLCQELSKY